MHVFYPQLSVNIFQCYV